MEEVEFRARINRVAEIIEKSLDRPLRLAEVAEEAGVSAFHLHRLFRLYTGEPLGTYIRRRRLAAGFAELRAAPERGVIEAALRAGYESLSSFTRAFRRQFGLPPASLLGRAKAGLLRPPSRGEVAPAVEPSRIDLRPPIHVVAARERGYEGRSFARAAERGFGRLLAWTDAKLPPARLGRTLGVAFEDPDLADPGSIEYLAGIELLGDGALPPIPISLEHREIAGGRYAVFTHRGSYRTLWQTWNVAYRHWLPQSGTELRDSPPFEIYVVDPRASRRPRDWVTEIHLPID